MSFARIMRRMTDRVLSHAGESAVLRGDTPCLVNVERGVTVQYEVGQDKFYQSEYASVVDVANIDSRLIPRHGDTLSIEHDDGTIDSYKIDALLSDNGYLSRCVLITTVEV